MNQSIYDLLNSRIVAAEAERAAAASEALRKEREQRERKEIAEYKRTHIELHFTCGHNKVLAAYEFDNSDDFYDKNDQGHHHNLPHPCPSCSGLSGENVSYMSAEDWFLDFSKMDNIVKDSK